MDTDQALRDAVNRVLDPIGGRGLVDSGRAAAPRLVGGVARVIVDVSGVPTARHAPLEEAVKEALMAVEGVASTRVLLTSQKTTRRIVAVGSGKGGVGKSTLSANLAIALARSGLKVGLVDADIYGPSQPRLMSAEGTRPQAEGQKLLPVATAYGVPLLSMGMLVQPGQAIAWRGPMAGNALGQLLDADWGEAEILIVDLPPGTGDVQLSMISKHKPAGAIIVSTPQDLALMDATRAIDLFNQSTVPIVGIIENMAGYECPHCGEVSDPFGIGGAEAAARSMGVPFLGRVPLDVAIRRASDLGHPPAAMDGEPAAPFLALARGVRDWLDRNETAAPAA
ncbi:MAG: Mrp/NBP35 family ATP-binding protein [Sphingomonadaceae bacterium]|nr:Mrp/NBP35 family ATP-binding protein [Sphingomonadaceae bacterium]